MRGRRHLLHAHADPNADAAGIAPDAPTLASSSRSCMSTVPAPGVPAQTPRAVAVRAVSPDSPPAGHPHHHADWGDITNRTGSTGMIMEVDGCGADAALQVLHNMRDHYPELADVVMHVNDGNGGTVAVEAHRIVLVSASETWRAMLYGRGGAGVQFMEAGLHKEGRVRAPVEVRFDTEDSAHITANVLHCVLDHVYGKTARVHQDDLQAVASAADYLALPDLLAGCEQAAVSMLTVENAVEVLMEADRRGLQTVRAGSLRLIMEQFETVSHTRGFLEHMGLRLLVDILDQDVLRVKSERVVFEAAVRWLGVPGRGRAGGEPAQRLLQRVRYPLMDSHYLTTRVSHCEEAGVGGSEEALKELVSEALVLKSTRLDHGEVGVQRALAEGLLQPMARMRPRVGWCVDVLAMECTRVVPTGHAALISRMVEVGPWAVTGSKDRSFRVWNQSTWECKATVVAHNHAVSAMAVCGGLLLTASARVIKVWEPASDGGDWKCTQVLEGGLDYVWTLLVVDEVTLLSGGGDKVIRVWDQSTWECVRTVPTEHSGDVGINSLAANDGLVYSGGGTGDGTIHVWDRATWRCVTVLRGHTDGVEQMLVWQAKLLSASYDKTIKAWGLVTADGGGGECEQTLEGHYGAVTSIVVCGNSLLSGSGDKSIRVWNLRRGEWRVERTFQNAHDGDAVKSIVCTRDGRRVLSCGYDQDRRIRVWCAG